MQKGTLYMDILTQWQASRKPSAVVVEKVDTQKVKGGNKKDLLYVRCKSLPTAEK